MAKTSPIFSVVNYGIYEKWDQKRRGLPKIKQVTECVPAVIDIEFGLIINIKKGKGISIDWCIEHPHITDKKGRLMAPFEGKEIVRNNDWQFYLGDTIWAPEHDKVGDWRMYIQYNSEIVIDKTFELTDDDIEEQKEREFWKRRGF